jgi:hypothetical protein
MVQVWDFPFRLGPDGSVATVEQDSDRDLENLIAVAVYTRPGERVQCPTFGIADPVFTGWERASLARHLLDFGPAVDIVDMSITRQVGDREEVLVTWERQ